MTGAPKDRAELVRLLACLYGNTPYPSTQALARATRAVVGIEAAGLRIVPATPTGAMLRAHASALAGLLSSNDAIEAAIEASPYAPPEGSDR